MSTPSLARQAGFLFAGRLLAFAGVFLLPLLLVRLFDQRVFGLYRQFFVVFYFFYLLGQAGMTQSLTAILPKQPEDASSLLSNLLLFLTGVGVCSVIMGGLLYQPRAQNLYAFAPMMGLFVGLMVFSSFFEPLLILEKKSRAVAVLIVLWDLTRALFLLLTAWWTRSLVATLWAVNVAATLRCLAMWIYIRRHYTIGFGALSFPLFLRQLRMAMPLGLQAGAHLIETHFDRYIVLFFFSPVAFAIYTVGVFQIPIVEMVFHSVAGVVLPRLVELYGQNKLDEMLSLWNDTVRRSALLFLPMFCIFLLVHEELMLVLFTSKYQESVPLFRVFLWIIPTYIVSNNSLLQAAEHASYLTYAALIKPMIAIIFVLYGLDSFGLLGGVGGLVLYHYVAVLIYTALSARALSVRFIALFPVLSLFRISLLSSIVCAVVWFIEQGIVSLYLKLLTKPLLFVVLFVVLSLYSRCLAQADRDDIVLALSWFADQVRKRVRS